MRYVVSELNEKKKKATGTQSRKCGRKKKCEEWAFLAIPFLDPTVCGNVGLRDQT